VVVTNSKVEKNHFVHSGISYVSTHGVIYTTLKKTNSEIQQTRHLFR